MFKKSFFAKITGIKTDDEKKADQREEPQTQGDEGATQSQQSEGEWVPPSVDGQLSVDVYQTDKEIVIKSAVAGVDAQDLDISISNDMITIRGSRAQDEHIEEADYFYQECYWGSFSRSIILPEVVKAEDAVAEFKKGILT